MAGPRISMFWPLLVRHAEASNPAVRATRAAARMRAFHQSSRQRRPDTVNQRYGTANEPPPHLGGGKGIGPSTTKETNTEPPKALPKIGQKLQQDGEEEVRALQAEQKQANTASQDKTPGPILSDPALDATESEVTEKPTGSPQRAENNAIETLLDSVPGSRDTAQQQGASPTPQTEPPKPSSPEEQASIVVDEHAPPAKAPHIDAPRHVHHFDTYGLVRRLVDQGWSELQAITIMKAVRLMLADNMQLAREALVSKSQVENETYLFRAACAELKTEVTSRRKVEQEKMRTERSQLQHELDMLSQRLGQESGVLKDELKGMFDDRKMAVRNEQRSMESKIQRLNYKITVDLQADGKSEVEGLRWVMTRRVIIALGVVVIMVLSSLKLYSNSVHELDTDAKRRAAAARNGGAQPELGLDAEMRVGDMVVKEGDNPAFVSLG